MKSWGLAAAGVVSRTFLSRVPILSRNLGPVVSTSFRVATRISNALRSGTAVRTAAELQPAQEILICVPGSHSVDLLSPAFIHAIDWKGKVVLFCDSAENLPFRELLKIEGAYAGSLTTVPQLPGCLLLEGDRAAVRTGQAIANALKARTFHIPQERLLLFQAAITASRSLFLPLMETVVECLRQCGVREPFVGSIAETLFQNSLRAYRRSGRKSWDAPASRESVGAQIDALRSVRPSMGEFFDSAQHSSQLSQLIPKFARSRKQSSSRLGSF